MAHDRKLVLRGVALTMAKLPPRQMALAMEKVRDDLELEMIQSGYLDGAPFKWVGLMIREGLQDEAAPHYQRISAKHGDLPVAIEIDTHRLVGASAEQSEAVYRKATLMALLDVAEKYGLNDARMRELLVEMEN